MPKYICQHCHETFLNPNVSRPPIYCSPQCDGDRKRLDRDKALWERIDQSGGPDACWIWKGAKSPLGYGRLKIQTKYKVKVWSPHRLAYELTYSPIPPDLIVCHRCDVPSCCNPKHLFLGTYKDNTHDAYLKGRLIKGSKQVNAKLTEEQVAQIRTMRASMTLKVIAERFNISISSVSQIALRKQWKHVP